MGALPQKNKVLSDGERTLVDLWSVHSPRILGPSLVSKLTMKDKETGLIQYFLGSKLGCDVYKFTEKLI